jgi:hypothetical protein
MLAHQLKETKIKVNSADLPKTGATGGYFDDKGVLPR